MCVDIIEKALNQVKEKQKAPVTNPRVASVFRANTQDTENFFTTPTLSSEAKDLLRRENPHLKKQFLFQYEIT